MEGAGVSASRATSMGGPGPTWAVALVVLLGGCSSTVTEPSADGTDPSADRSAVGVSSPFGLEEPAATSPPARAQQDETPTVPASTDQHATAERPSPISVPTAAGTADPCPIPVEPGAPGITQEEIAVGVPRYSDLAAVAPDAPEHDPHEYVEALVDHINTTGGIACRQVRIIWHEVDTADPTWSAATEQEMCATWTEDHEVLAAFPGPESNLANDVLYSCLDRAGVAIIDTRGVVARDAESFAEIPRLVAVNGVLLDRGAAAQVHALVRQGFLTTDSRIGVVYYDSPAYVRTVDEALVPALARHGLELAERRAVTSLTSSADEPARQRDVANAMLRFRLAGIDRVLFVRGRGLAYTFMQAAEANQYRPRYGLTSDEVEVVGIGAPAQQLVGAHGIGWIPDLDLFPRRPEAWPARESCLDFFRGRGFTTATWTDQVIAMVVCEAFGFLEAAVRAAPPPLSADAVVTGATRLGSSYESPLVRWTEFGPERRDGVETYRDTIHDGECACFTYVGETRQLP